MTMNDDVFLEFGDPTSAVDVSHISDYLGVFASHDGQYYVPPVSLKGLSNLTRAHPTQTTLPHFTTNMLLKHLEPNVLLNQRLIRQASIDFRTMGNAYIQFLRNKFGQVVGAKHVPAINVRKLTEGGYGWLNTDGTITKFKPGEIFHLADYETNQTIYGVPYWHGAIQSILLGEDVTLFPRRFFRNGAHMGNLFVTSGLSKEAGGKFEADLRKTKGVGNFRSSHIGLGKNMEAEKHVKVIPIGKLDGKSAEFIAFLNASKSAVLEAWRVRPELAGMMPTNTGGSGDLHKILIMNYEQEVVPYQQQWQEINEYLPVRHHLTFKVPDNREF